VVEPLELPLVHVLGALIDALHSLEVPSRAHDLLDELRSSIPGDGEQLLDRMFGCDVVVLN
jgi:hypothetical protein